MRTKKKTWSYKQNKNRCQKIPRNFTRKKKPVHK